jgi:hypothetical protein
LPPPGRTRARLHEQARSPRGFVRLPRQRQPR